MSLQADTVAMTSFSLRDHRNKKLAGLDLYMPMSYQFISRLITYEDWQITYRSILPFKGLRNKKRQLQRNFHTYSMLQTLEIRYKDRIANSWILMNALHHFSMVSHLKHIIIIRKHRNEQDIKYMIDLLCKLSLYIKHML